MALANKPGNLSALIIAIAVISIYWQSAVQADQPRRETAVVSGQMTCPSPGMSVSVPDEIWDRMQGVSWHENLACPSRETLRYLRIPYLNFYNRPQMGEMIVAKSVAPDVLWAFQQIYCSGAFLIEEMQLIDRYDGSDSRSMADNNTSGFNCRLTSNGKRLSEHSFGKAIDINPVQNPYVRNTTTLPAQGKAYNSEAKRLTSRPGIIKNGDVVTKTFAAIAWKWGGDWKNSKDYQHFSSTGR
jgi:hypothetical protein